LIVVPFYFFGALTLLSGFVLVARLMRLPVSINALVIASIVLSLLSLAVPLWLDWIDLTALTGRRAAILLVASFVFAGLDALLKDPLPLPLDQELEAED
jgi:hypothetical protein